MLRILNELTLQNNEMQRIHGFFRLCVEKQRCGGCLFIVRHRVSCVVNVLNVDTVDCDETFV